MPSKQTERGERKPRKYWVFGVYLDPPYFYMFIFGLALFAIFLTLALIFSPPEFDLINLFLSMAGILISAFSVMFGATKSYFDMGLDGINVRINAGFHDLCQEIGRSFNEVASLLREIRDELRGQGQ